MSRIKRLHPLMVVALAACSAASQTAPAPAPQQVQAGTRAVASDNTPAPEAGRRAVGKQGAVSSANPLASEAGLAMLRAGGNAVDAAVATAFAIGVVEPHMSGLGGGGSALIWMKGEGKPEFLDFYAAQYVPSFAGHLGDGPRPDLRVVAIPGGVAGLLEMHQRYGKLPLAQVLAPAIELAEKGFPVGQILSAAIASDSTKLFRFPESKKRYFPNGKPLQPGEIIRNPELATALRLIAEKGREGFYSGPVAEALVAALNEGGHPATLEHLAQYRPIWRRPLCAEYRGHIVFSAPPPQTGVRVIHTLKLLESFDIASLGLPTRSAEAFKLLASALRAGIAGTTIVGDPRWTRVPANGAVSEAYARSRANLVGTGRPVASLPRPDAQRFDNQPPSDNCRRFDPYGPAPAVSGTAADWSGAVAVASPAEVGAAGAAEGDVVYESEYEGGETTHLSVVDKDGNAVALTQTNSSLFGVGAWVHGFFLNDSGVRVNEAMLRDAASRGPWRTRASSISPTIILDDAGVKLVVGAPGSGRIPPAVTQTIVYILDYGLDAVDAARMPRMFPSTSRTSVEVEHGFSPSVLAEVRKAGYDPRNPPPAYARIYLVARQGDSWVGAADPRHDGEARAY